MAERFIEIMTDNGLLIHSTENIYKDTMLEKQWYYLEGLLSQKGAISLQDNISSATVVILGVGGVGSVVINSLARAGVKSFILIDFDNVSHSNLNRQILFAESDVGKNKLACAKKRIAEISPIVFVETISTRIESISSLERVLHRKIDILVNAADTPTGIETLVHKFGYLHGISTISCSVGRNYATWGPLFVPGKTCCYQCFNKYEESLMSEHEKFIKRIGIKPMETAFGPVNSIISDFMAKDILMFLALGYDNNIVPSINCRCGINFSDLTFSRSTPEKILCDCW